MPHDLHIDLQDADQIDEIHLLAELMVLASESMGALDPATVDATLGVAGPAFPEQRLG